MLETAGALPTNQGPITTSRSRLQEGVNISLFVFSHVVEDDLSLRGGKCRAIIFIAALRVLIYLFSLYQLS